MKGLGGGRLRSVEVDRSRLRSVEVDGCLGRFLVHVLVVLMDLEAETLSELRSVYALSIYIGFGSRFY